ncbi:hypothetical protein LPJ38_12735 [Bradyrhizobium daqingense]|uniref:Uncharacterized protein n=1 Tax=Bradyrhizobium daqingense TaxID=993502 RepID=A0A562KRC8_9BRAD|nr:MULTISPECIES: hypothetical protein [Bradyrhizobium]MDQ8731728.1 hypothetical protein [Bradyrhizobium sp. LHD-71]TWH97952.1 hypothetical protein IQ17_06190 [Bradyrhizobium daqingense]UFS91549.1 hypothetical protein LPJ38_12735 [Bradyrhizobium daqingense]
MITSKLLPMGLIAAALIGGPVMAREHHAPMRQPVMQSDTVASNVPIYQDSRGCVPAPRVGAFATAPWTGNNVPCEPGTGAF